jgi:hypothetical protein
MNSGDGYEKSYKKRPHVVILGAGASMAAIPNGDENGMRTSVMDGFLEKLGMAEIIENLELKTRSKNLEDIYSEIAEEPRYAEVRERLDTCIRDYFSKFKIPARPTVYDFLLLSLRKKDLVATFNWDPLLLQAYDRVSKITDDLPDLAFLHGNVLTGYCAEHKFGGTIVGRVCPVCTKPFTPSRLLYPIAKKNYNEDPFTIDNWKALRNFLKKAYIVTIFGYSAPKTDVEAVDIMNEAWGGADARNMEDFEFIDIRDEESLVATWKDFVHTHHYTYANDFFNSSMARFPRRTVEEVFDRTQNCLFLEPGRPFTKDMGFSDISKMVNDLVREERENIGGYITLKSIGS